MNIALYGATGNIGRRILDEALRRGHQVTAIVRDPARLAVSDSHLTITTGDAQDPSSVAASVAGHDAVVGSISGRRDGDTNLIADAARSLLTGTEQAGVPRLLWVGGASSLEIAPGVRLIDSPDFPDAYRGEALAGLKALEMFRTAQTPVDWTYLSPAAEIGPGERTGVFRLGTDQLLTGPDGHSRISFEDYAVALVDELESPTHSRSRFTLAY